MRPTNSPATGAGALNRFNSAPTSLLESLIEAENEGEVDNDGGVLEALLDEAVFLASQGMSVSCSDSRSIRSPNEVSSNHHNRPDYEALERMKIKDSSSMFLPTGFDSIGKYESPVDHSHTVVTGSMDDLWKLQPQNRPVSIAENFPSPKRGLVRHNSTPPDFLNQICSDVSRGDGYLLAMAPPVSESYINPGMSGSVSPMSGGYSGTESVSHFPQVSKSMTNVQTEHDTSGRLARRGGLARHSSLPGEFISQLASDLGKIEENCNGFGAADDSLMARKRFRVPEQSSTSTDPSDYILEQLNSRFTASLHESPDSPLPANTTTCQLRAKRGYATHPRSIAERQRRTRISEGIKKLQDLVPNVDKNLNTAEMLDEAVEYIKFLQRQVQELSLNSPPRSA